MENNPWIEVTPGYETPVHQQLTLQTPYQRYESQHVASEALDSPFVAVPLAAVIEEELDIDTSEWSDCATPLTGASHIGHVLEATQRNRPAERPSCDDPSGIRGNAARKPIVPPRRWSTLAITLGSSLAVLLGAYWLL